LESGAVTGTVDVQQWPGGLTVRCTVFAFDMKHEYNMDSAQRENKEPEWQP